MTEFLIETGILALIFVCIHYALNKNDKNGFIVVLLGAIVAAVIAMIILKVAFRDGPGIGTDESPTKE